jgi:hypothetical protein
MKYVIRKVPERNTEYLEKLLPEAVVVNDVNHNGAIWSFLKAIEVADDDAIYIQDDMLLCKDFKKRAEAYVEKYPDEVISFSSQKSVTFNVESEGFSNKSPLWDMCIYIPKKIAQAYRTFHLAEGYKKFYRWEIFLEKSATDTLLERYVYQVLKKSVFNVCPSLAGHKPLESVAVKGRKPRLSPLFDYENCEKDMTEQ